MTERCVCECLWGGGDNVVIMVILMKSLSG